MNDKKRMEPPDSTFNLSDAIHTRIQNKETYEDIIDQYYGDPRFEDDVRGWWTFSGPSLIPGRWDIFAKTLEKLPADHPFIVDNLTTFLPSLADSNGTVTCYQFAEIFLILVKKGLDKDFVFENGYTIYGLTILNDIGRRNAAMYGSSSELSALGTYVDLGATMNQKDIDFLMRCITQGSNEMYSSNVLDALLSTGLDLCRLTASNGDNIIHAAAAKAELRTFNRYIGLGCDLNALDSSGNTALHICAELGKNECCTYLLVANADTSIRNKDGKTFQDIITSKYGNRDSSFNKVMNIYKTLTATSYGESVDPQSTAYRLIKNPDHLDAFIDSSTPEYISKVMSSMFWILKDHHQSKTIKAGIHRILMEIPDFILGDVLLSSSRYNFNPNVHVLLQLVAQEKLNPSILERLLTSMKGDQNSLHLIYSEFVLYLQNALRPSSSSPFTSSEPTKSSAYKFMQELLVLVEDTSFDANIIKIFDGRYCFPTNINAYPVSPITFFFLLETRREYDRIHRLNLDAHIAFIDLFIASGMSLTEGYQAAVKISEKLEAVDAEEEYGIAPHDAEYFDERELQDQLGHPGKITKDGMIEYHEWFIIPGLKKYYINGQ